MTKEPDKLRLEIADKFSELNAFKGWLIKSKRKNRINDILS